VTDRAPAVAPVPAAVVVGSPASMRAVGRALATGLRAGDLVLLSGPLGAGKTTLAQGVGEGLGVRGPVTSPTFVIAREHPPLVVGGTPLVHVDAYRVGDALEVADLDLDASVEEAVTLVEWGDGKVEALAPSYLVLRLDRADEGAAADGADGDEPRRLTVDGYGPRWPPAEIDRLRATVAAAAA
jgi:tRNA threonylcarbamoyl adenosine modification protein YjeE